MTDFVRKRTIPAAVRAVFAMAVACLPGAAQPPQVFVSGLQNPSKIILSPGGKFLVTEATSTPNSGRISLIDSMGSRTTLIDGLPSGLAAPDMSVDGPNGLAIRGRTLYVANGEGDSHRNGPSPGSIVPNPLGPSSPLFASILAVDLSTDIDNITVAFSLKLKDQFTLADGNPVTLDNGAGGTAKVTLLAAFRDVPDPNTIYRNSHPYGLAIVSSQPNVLYMADAGMNTIVRVDIATGRWNVITRFPVTPNTPPAMPPVSEAVPTSVRAYGDQLLVSLLSGAPFVPGASRIVQVDPTTGNAYPFIPFLSSAIDVLYKDGANGTTQFFALQYSTDFTAMPPGLGLLTAYSTDGTVNLLASRLTTPSSMAFGADSKNIYVTDRSNGTVVVVNAPVP